MIRSFNRHALVHRSIIPCQRARILDPSFRRFVSTIPEPSKSPEPFESSLGVPRKHKVNLGPSPIKPSSQTTASKPPLKPVSDAAKKDLTPPTNTSKSPSSSIVEAAKHDYEEARKHGILVPPPANAGRIQALWHQAKEIFKFYMRGIKMIWTHRKRVNEIEARVKAGGEPLSRWEARFIETFRIDAKKLVPFLLILVIIEEIIPLVVLYAPFMLPSTCVLPSQRERILLKQRESIGKFAETGKPDFKQLLQRGDATTPLGSLISGTQLVSMCGILSLSTYGPTPLRLSRIRRSLERITQDDARLNQEGQDQRLTLPELQEALDERGFATNGLQREDMQIRLRWWLSQVEGTTPSGDSLSKRALLIARVHAGDGEKLW